MAHPLTYEKDFGLTLAMTPAEMAAATIAHTPRVAAHERVHQTGLAARMASAITAFHNQCVELLYRDDGSFVDHALRSHHRARLQELTGSDVPLAEQDPKIVAQAATMLAVNDEGFFHTIEQTMRFQNRQRPIEHQLPCHAFTATLESHHSTHSRDLAPRYIGPTREGGDESSPIHPDQFRATADEERPGSSLAL